MRALLVALMLMIGSQAGAEISGSMSCKVKSNSVTALEEGKTIFYSSIEGEFKKGDTLIFTYMLSPGLALSMSLTKEISADIKSGIVINDIFFTDELIKDDGRITLKKLGWRKVYISEENIMIDNNSGILRLNRYYKGDFQGYFLNNDSSFLTVQLATFDCRPIDDKISEIISSF